MQRRNEYTVPLPPVQPQLSPLQSDGLPRMDPFFSSEQQGVYRDRHTTVSPLECPMFRRNGLQDELVLKRWMYAVKTHTLHGTDSGHILARTSSGMSHSWILNRE